MPYEESEFEEYKTSEEVVAEGNYLAKLFYASMGCRVPEGYKFYEATHPQEIGCWNLAVIAYAHIEGTDLEECLDEMECG
ncbi:hypothetical protein U2F10_03125 [Leptothoe sp. EHU-05/26/07-4]